MIRPLTHILLHLLVPFLLARRFSPAGWKRPFLLMMLAWGIDLDHLLATPIYQSDRCSIGLHPLHGWAVLVLAFVLLSPRQTRWLGLGLLLHLSLDGLDCALIGWGV